MGKRFPILDAGFSVPWELVEPFDEQAKKNHDQSLEILARRGGLSPKELYCVMHGLRYPLGWATAPSEAECLVWARSLSTIDIKLALAAPELLQSIKALGICGGGYCFCFNGLRDPDKVEHTDECSELRAIIASAGGLRKEPDEGTSNQLQR